jgi:hypothetical protein
MKRRNDPYYGQDSGQALSRQALDEIQKNDGESNLQEFEEQAEETIELLKEINPYFWRLHGEELDKLKQELMEAAAEAAGGPKKRPATEEREEPMLTRAAQDKFFSDPEEMKKYTSRKL